MSRPILFPVTLLLGVLLAFTAPHSSSPRRIDKCCPPGDVLVLNDTGNFACRRRTSPPGFLDLREGESRGLPVCSDSGYLVQRLAEDPLERLPSDSCLEIFFDSSLRQDFPVIVYCNSKVELVLRSGHLEYLEDSALPLILSFRKCCPPDKLYDVERKFCVDGQADFKRLLGGRVPGADFIDVYSGPPTCRHALIDYKVQIQDVYGDDGDISISIPWKGQLRNITINMHNSCLDAEATSSSLVGRVCSEADYCAAKSCIRKCCPENKINSECVDPPENVSLENFRTSLASAATNSTALPPFDVKNYGLMVGKPCELYFTLDPDETWEIGPLGELLVEGDLYNYVNYCMEYMHNSSILKNGLTPFICFEDDVYNIPDARYEITVGLALTSCGFLLTTLAVYICLPSLQNLHGKTLMCHVVSLFFAYAFLAANGLITRRVLESLDDDVADALCKFIGYAMVFCFHSAFFWLNVMCFDIWWTFGGVQGAASAATKRRRQRNTFLTYCGYAWGLAFLLTGLSALLEYLGLLNSSIGRERCWFEHESIAEVIFFIVPVSVTLLINTVFFIITSYRCSKVKAEIKRVMANVKDPTARKFHSDKTRLIMNVKLFVVMGIPWLLENIPAYLNHYNQLPVLIQEIFYVADIINSLQGLWIFILFVLKPKVYRALRKRLGGQRNKSASNNTLNVQGLHPVRKSASNTTLTSNFIVSSATTT